MLIYCELILGALLVLLFLCLGRRPCQRRLGRAFTRLANRQGLAVLLVGALALTGSLSLALLAGWPEPHYTDEFSYLLAADTFAHGRLTNPTHPHWAHFENFHVIHQPTYASQYPPAQGLMLALGQVLTGRPIVGVWLSLSLACMALCWMLQAWLPPRWALFGALLATTRLVFWGHPFSPDDLLPGYWSQSFFGGAVAAGGGALVFGGLRRLIARPRASQALLLALGLVILATSRPYEGLAASLPAAFLMLAWLTGPRRPPWRVALGSVVAPIALVLLLGLSALGYYHYRVTGRPTTPPYTVHERAYATTPIFLWQSLPTPPAYRHKALEENYLGWYLEEHHRQQSLSGLGRYSALKTGKLLGFYLGPLLLLPLVALRPALRAPWARFALLTCAVELAAFLLPTGAFPHYAAPITCLLYLLAVSALRQVRLWRRHGLPLGQACVRALPLAYALLVVLSLVVEKRPGPDDRHVQRARILADLRREGGRHLILVRYRSKPLGVDHEEWAYNDADIDAAPVVWAREMGGQDDSRLLEYFRDRRVWRVDADARPPVLTPCTAPTTDGLARRPRR